MHFGTTAGAYSGNGGAIKRKLVFTVDDAEEELKDLLTYDCPITGTKRCPPCLSLACALANHVLL